MKKKLGNRDRIKEYQLKSRDKIIARKKFISNNKYNKDISFQLFCKTRSRTREVLIGKSKSISTKKFSGNDIDTYRKWIEY